MINRISKAISSFTTKLKNFLWPNPTYWVAIALSIFFVSISMLAILENTPISTSPNLLAEGQLAGIDIQGGEELGQIDQLARVSNNSMSTMGILIPLYSKLNSSDILGNNIRENILTIITENPGITLGSITRKLKLKNGTATHHVRILEREGYIKSKKVGKFRRYYRVGIKATGLNEIQDQIVTIIQDTPGISQSEIARQLNLSRQLVNYHLKDLISEQVIRAEKMGNKCCCFYIN